MELSDEARQIGKAAGPVNEDRIQEAGFFSVLGRGPPPAPGRARRCPRARTPARPRGAGPPRPRLRRGGGAAIAPVEAPGMDCARTPQDGLPSVSRARRQPGVPRPAARRSRRRCEKPFGDVAAGAVDDPRPARPARPPRCRPAAISAGARGTGKPPASSGQSGTRRPSSCHRTRRSLARILGAPVVADRGHRAGRR